MNIIQEISFFKDMEGLTRIDFRDLAAAFQLREIKEKTNVFKYGDEGDFFYVIIEGKIGVHIPNPLIRFWE